MSKIGWIDFSSDERDKVKQVLDALNEPGTLDELGIGQIRDAFANRLFPGLSTIQTRAKYFITVSRLLRGIQMGNAKKSKTPQLWLERQEHLLAQQLVDASYRDSGLLEQGIIGAESIKQGGVSRRPSSIYWNGLKTFGIVHTALSLREFCSKLANNSHVAHTTDHTHQEGADDDDVDRMMRLIDLPNTDDYWQSDEKLSIHLTEVEAQFLRDKLMTAATVEHSVPAQILKVGGVSALLQRAEDVQGETVTLDAFEFDVMVEVLINHHKVSELCKNRLKQAQAFSLAMEGPHICYNLLLEEDKDLKASRQIEFYEWEKKAKRQKVFHKRCVDNWFDAILGSRINPKSRDFVASWCELMQQGASQSELESLVDSRARANKGPRCLLNKKRHSKGWTGIRRLEFRWPNARRLLVDIEDGLEGGEC